MQLKNINSFALLFLFSFLISPAYFAQEEIKLSIKDLLLNEVQKHPESRVQDIYKFLHQAAFGSEHAVKDTSGVRKWMENEIANLDYNQDDDLADQLSPDGVIVRINLRSYLKAGYDPEILLQAFIKTANNYKGSEDNFKSFRNSASELAGNNKFSFTEEELNGFFNEQSKKGFPAVHHSKEYGEKYKPAYRVVDINYLHLPETH